MQSHADLDSKPTGSHSQPTLILNGGAAILLSTSGTRCASGAPSVSGKVILL
jgi:hypothetical protein